MNTPLNGRRQPDKGGQWQEQETSFCQELDKDKDSLPMSEREVTFVTYLKLTRSPSFLVFTEGSKQCEELTRNVKHLYPGHNKTRGFTEILVAITIIARQISRYQAIKKLISM